MRKVQFRMNIVCISCPNIFLTEFFLYLIANSSIVGHKHNHKLFFLFLFSQKFFFFELFFLMRFSAFNDNLMILKHFNCVFKVKNNSNKYKLFYKMFVLCDFYLKYFNCTPFFPRENDEKTRKTVRFSRSSKRF